MKDEVTKEIYELAESVLSDKELFLIDVEVKGGRQPIVWVYIDAEDRGVNMDECAEVSNELSFLMDAHDLLSGGYRINVSSPGLSRPLSDIRQYPKNKGRKIRVKYTSDGEYLKAEGILKEVGESRIAVETEEGDILELDLDQLVESKIIPSI